MTVADGRRMSEADRAGLAARSPEGHAAKSMHIRGKNTVFFTFFFLFFTKMPTSKLSLRQYVPLVYCTFNLVTRSQKGHEAKSDHFRPVKTPIFSCINIYLINLVCLVRNLSLF